MLIPILTVLTDVVRVLTFQPRDRRPTAATPAPPGAPAEAAAPHPGSATLGTLHDGRY
jgi:hypothetical protein